LILGQVASVTRVKSVNVDLTAPAVGVKAGTPGVAVGPLGKVAAGDTRADVGLG
jgi:hypothetical protein